MRFKFLQLCLFLMFLWSPCLAWGQDSVTVNNDTLNQLIETLESDAEREEFIENLKTIKDTHEQKSQEEQEPGNVPLSEVLGVNEQVDSIIESYTNFLSENNLNTSTVGQSFMTVGVLFIYIVIFYMVRRLGITLRDYLLKVKNIFGIQHDRFRLYARTIRYCGYVIVSMLFIYTLGMVWGITDYGFLTADITVSLIGELLNILFIALIAVVCWEFINGAIEFALRKSNGQSENRLRTLLPIARNVLFVVFLVLFTLVFLSELGVNIVPLLAGAGIFGIAIGFGAQTMVKDFLTGFTIIFEDLIQVGDVATVGGKTGFIERITIRKVQLRDLDGTVYTVPFSEINVVENLTKDFSFYLMDIGIAYRENTDKVIGYLKEIDEEMRSEDAYKNLILEPLEVFGVDQFADSAVIIKARMKTRPIKQWEVGREFNRRMKIKFDEHNVEIPFPHQTVYFGEDKKGKAPAAHLSIQGVENATSP